MLEKLKLSHLTELFLEVFGHPTASHNASWLRRKLAAPPDPQRGCGRWATVRTRDAGAAIWNNGAAQAALSPALSPAAAAGAAPQTVSPCAHAQAAPAPTPPAVAAAVFTTLIHQLAPPPERAPDTKPGNNMIKSFRSSLNEEEASMALALGDGSGTGADGRGDVATKGGRWSGSPAEGGPHETVEGVLWRGRT